VITITEHEIRQTEECLYVNKYLYGRIQELDIEMDCIFPPGPGSVLKIVGIPVAKNPLDTSQTEEWGIRRATCKEAVELDSKLKLYHALRDLTTHLQEKEYELYTLKYYKEYPVPKVKSLLEIDHQTYYTIRQSLIRKTWKKIKDLDFVVELAVQ